MNHRSSGHGLARVLLALVGLSASCLPGAAFAQEPRPSEDQMFGEEPPAAEEASRDVEAPGKPAEVGIPAPPAGEEPGLEDSRDDRLLGTPDAATNLSTSVAPGDPLTIGGQVYLRSLSTARESDGPSNWTFSTPTLVDAYFDARPNERVRAYVLGRMAYDPTLADSASANRNTGQVAGTGSVQGSTNLSSLFQSPTRGPRVILDQLWLRFDLGHRVFVTAGKQHVRWGTARFWMPGDFLHIRRRNPLDVFDARAGTTMVKFHLPVEELGWNFYAYAVTESASTTSNLRSIAGAARGEFVLATAELGLSALVQADQKPKWQADISTGLGPFDLYGEVALRYGSEIDRVAYNANGTVAPPPERLPWQDEGQWRQQYLQSAVDALYPTTRQHGIKPQAVGGLTYQLQYADKDMLLLGAEYFYNPLGYDSPTAYPGLVLPHSRPLAEPATFFYLGRHYAAVFASLPAPYNWDLHSFTVSTLGNLSDQSFISRFDYTYTLLTHIRFEAFASVRYGRREGEFRFGVDRLQLGNDVANLRPLSLKPTAFDFGLAIRVAI